MEVLTTEAFLYANGVVFKVQNIKATLSHRLDLTAFPFDSHKLCLTMLSSTNPTQDIAIRLQSSTSDWSVDPWIEGWDVTTTTHTIGTKIMADAETTLQDWDVYTLEIEVDRQPEYYMFNQYLPMAVIMMMATSAFLFELNAYEKRVTILFTAILTLMAFSVYLGESLPKTAYVTNMHCVVYLCYFMLCTAGLWVCMTWLVLRDVCNLADLDGNSECTHYELDLYCRNMIQVATVHRAIQGAGCSDQSLKGSMDTASAHSSMENCSAGEQQLVKIDKQDVRRPTGRLGVMPKGSSTSPVIELELSTENLEALSEDEQRIWKTLDADNDGCISMEEMKTQYKSMPLHTWTTWHVFIFLRVHGAATEVASAALRHGVNGAMLKLFSDEAYRELGMSSAIMIAKMRFELDRNAHINESAVPPMFFSKVIKCCYQGSADKPNLMLAIVHLDFHMRWFFMALWCGVSATLLSAGGGTTYDASLYGITALTTDLCGEFCSSV